MVRITNGARVLKIAPDLPGHDGGYILLFGVALVKRLRGDETGAQVGVFWGENNRSPEILDVGNS